MNECLIQHGEEIVTEISMSNHNFPWLIVEGNTDGRFFSTKKIHGAPITVIALGWENVVAIISKVIEESIAAIVFGFIDRDYREHLGVSIDYNKIVITDYRDLEISFFESTALHRVLVEYGSRNKLPSSETGDVNIEEVKEKIYSVASKMGRLRYYNNREKIFFSMKGLDYSKFIDAKSLDIDIQNLVAQINSRGESKITEKIVVDAFSIDLPEQLNDFRYLCSGHDVMELLGVSLKKLWGSNNSGVVEREKLEAIFRIGFSDNDFYQTLMYQKLDSLLKQSMP